MAKHDLAIGLIQKELNKSWGHPIDMVDRKRRTVTQGKILALGNSLNLLVKDELKEFRAMLKKVNNG